MIKTMYSYFHEWKEILKQSQNIRIPMKQYSDILESTINKYLGDSNNLTLAKLYSLKFDDFSFAEKKEITISFLKTHEAIAQACIINEHARRINIEIYSGQMDLFYIAAISDSVNQDIIKYVSKIRQQRFPQDGIIEKIKKSFGFNTRVNLKKFLEVGY